MKRLSKLTLLKGFLAIFILVFFFNVVKSIRDSRTQANIPPTEAAPAAGPNIQVHGYAGHRVVTDILGSSRKKTSTHILEYMGSNLADRPAPVLQPNAGGEVAYEEQEDNSSSYDPFRKIIRSADLSIQVKNVGDAYNRILTILNSESGYVLKSDFSQSDSSTPQSASFILEVPSDHFDSVLVDLSKIGKVGSRSIQGEDVTENYVDLQSRLRHLTDVEAQLSEILTRAKSINDILTVQNQLNAVQDQIEQTKGRLQLISHQSAMSQISVELSRLIPVVKPVTPTFTSVLWRQFEAEIKGALTSVMSAFVQTLSVFAILIIWVFGYIFPICLVAFLVWKLFLRYGRQGIA